MFKYVRGSVLLRSLPKMSAACLCFRSGRIFSCSLLKRCSASPHSSDNLERWSNPQVTMHKQQLYAAVRKSCYFLLNVQTQAGQRRGEWCALSHINISQLILFGNGIIVSSSHSNRWNPRHNESPLSLPPAVPFFVLRNFAQLQPWLWPTGGPLPWGSTLFAIPSRFEGKQIWYIAVHCRTKKV